MGGLDMVSPLSFVEYYLLSAVIIGIAALIAVLASGWNRALTMAACAGVGEYLVVCVIVFLFVGVPPWRNFMITPLLHVLDFVMYPIAYLVWVSVFFARKQLVLR
jgi:hypothetical protein